MSYNKHRAYKQKVNWRRLQPSTCLHRCTVRHNQTLLSRVTLDGGRHWNDCPLFNNNTFVPHTWMCIRKDRCVATSKLIIRVIETPHELRTPRAYLRVPVLWMEYNHFLIFIGWLAKVFRRPSWLTNVEAVSHTLKNRWIKIY